MSPYKIAWLPGDGVGKEVMEAARLVLDAVELDATYTHGDIGWEFWCREGESFPERTIGLLKASDAAMFGAITSKPAKEAEAELVPELAGTGLSYRSPIVRMRQLFDLYVCLRPCKAYPGSPLNFKEGIDIVVFRENTEDLYAGVEFATVPAELSEMLGRLSKPFAHFSQLASDEYAISCKVNTKKGSSRIVRAAYEFARKHGRKKVTVVHKANVVRATDGLFLEEARKVAKDYPEIAWDEANLRYVTGDLGEPVLRSRTEDQPVSRRGEVSSRGGADPAARSGDDGNSRVQWFLRFAHGYGPLPGFPSTHRETRSLVLSGCVWAVQLSRQSPGGRNRVLQLSVVCHPNKCFKRGHLHLVGVN